MSIVGPRPERPEIAAEYEKEMPEFRLRLQARYGLEKAKGAWIAILDSDDASASFLTILIPILTRYFGEKDYVHGRILFKNYLKIGYYTAFTFTIAWSTIIVYQGTKFKTVSGEVFSYKSSKSWKDTYILNLTINYEENIKSLAWEDVLLALKNIPKIGTVIEKPEALGNIRNVTYIYSIFYQFGLIDVPEDLKEKMGIRVAY